MQLLPEQSGLSMRWEMNSALHVPLLVPSALYGQAWNIAKYQNDDMEFTCT